MENPLFIQKTLSSHFLVRFCTILWRRKVIIFSALIPGILLFLSAFKEKHKPLDLLSTYPLANLLIGVVLIVLTMVVWGVSYFDSKTNPSTGEEIHAFNRQRNRTAMLRLLRNDCERRLTQSLQTAASSALELHGRQDIPPPQARLILYQRWQEPGNPLPAETSILDVYDLAGRNFLLLGEAGAGKTSLLLALASKLLIRAESDQSQPVPVIINISSRTTKKEPFSIWLRDQLRHFQINDALCESVLEENRWILLFDGLDEVEDFERVECIRAINKFREDYKGPPVVVCSGRDKYLSQNERLTLDSTVEVQPLQTREIVQYLEQIGEPASAILAAHRTNPTFQRLLTTPLMLNIILLTYSGAARLDIPRIDSPGELQRRIIAHYVERMLEQQTLNKRYPSQNAEHWLTWLAQRLNQQHITEFYLETLQPDWLSTKRARFTYNLLTWPVPALALCIITRVFFGVPDASIAGLLWGGIIVFMVELISIRPWKQLIKSQPNTPFLQEHSKLNLYVGLLAGLISGVIVGLYGGPVNGLIFGSNFGLACAYTGIPFGNVPERTKHTIFSEQINEKRAFTPDQGIHNHGLSTLYTGLKIGFFVWWYSALTHINSTALSLVILFTLSYTGRNYIFHYFLRFSLMRERAMPLNYVPFLEEMSDRNLLQRVGNGYCFIHPYLEQYFATQTQETWQIPAAKRE